MYSTKYWHDIYRRLIKEALCVDIETTEFDGPISMIGIYKPKDGEVECDSFVRGENLTAENLKAAFSGCKLLIAYNGYNFDIPKIREEFPGVIPDNVLVLDLYLFAKHSNLNTNLRVLENTFNIDRLKEESKKKGIAIKLWQRYEMSNDLDALKELTEYNKQDTINLYPLAEALMKQVTTQ